MFKQIRDYSGTRDSRHLGASAFIASATKQLPTTDVWCILYPSLRHFVRSDLQTLTEQSLLLTLKSPVGSIVFLHLHSNFTQTWPDVTPSL